MNELTDLKIEEISLCGEGKNPGAVISLIKSADVDNEVLEEAMVLKAYFNEVLAAEKFREEARMVIEPIWDLISILSTSIRMIYADDAKYPNKRNAIKESINQFSEYIKSRVDQMVNKSADSGDLNHKPEVKKGMDTTVNTYDQAAGTKAVDEAVQKAIEAKEVEIKKLKVLAQMTDMEKAYYNGLDQEDQILFINKSKDERTVLVEKHKQSDDSFDFGGTLIQKSKVGDALFAVLKSQKEQGDAAIQKAKDLEYVAKAQKEFPTLPGTDQEKGKILKAIDSIQDADNRQLVYETLSKACNAYSEGLIFSEVGETGENVGKAFESSPQNLGTIDTPEKAEKALNVYASQYAKEHDVSVAKGYTEVIKTDEGLQLYNLSKMNHKFKSK